MKVAAFINKVAVFINKVAVFINRKFVKPFYKNINRLLIYNYFVIQKLIIELFGKKKKENFYMIYSHLHHLHQFTPFTFEV
jgi:hypothetical protein